jgi:hypothetical protein
LKPGVEQGQTSSIGMYLVAEMEMQVQQLQDIAARSQAVWVTAMEAAEEQRQAVRDDLEAQLRLIQRTK